MTVPISAPHVIFSNLSLSPAL